MILLFDREFRIVSCRASWPRAVSLSFVLARTERLIQTLLSANQRHMGCFNRWPLVATNWKTKVVGDTRPEMPTAEKLQLGIWKGTKYDGFIFGKLEA